MVAIDLALLNDQSKRERAMIGHVDSHTITN